MSVFDAVGRNYGALRQQPDPQTLRAFQTFAAQQYAEALRLQSGSNTAALALGIVMLVITVFFAFGSLMVLMVVAFSGTGAGPVLGWLVVCLLILTPCVILTIVAFRLRKRGGPLDRWFRLYWFAQQNGFLFTPHTPNPYYPGMIFNQGYDRVSQDRVHSAQGQRYFDTGVMQYTVGTGKHRTDVRWSYLAFQLDRRLPHIVLDSQQNNASLLSIRVSNLPVAVTANQRLSLEGDFDRYFTLYCPKEYERDALYVLTPDVMALLIDEVAPFDVEIIDDLVFVYSHRVAGVEDESVARRMFAILDTIGRQALRQTQYYADERVADRSQNVVAPQGQRLKTRTPLIVTLATVAVFVFFALPRIVALIADIFFQ